MDNFEFSWLALRLRMVALGTALPSADEHFNLLLLWGLHLT